MNIKNARAEQLARRAAELEGSTLTGAIITALEEFVERRERTEEPFVQRLMDLSSRTAPKWSALGPAARVADGLYDDRGLPA